MKRVLTTGLLAVLLFAEASFAADNTAIVKRFVESFNQHDVDAMLELTANDIRWMSVSGDKVSVETSGHEQLRTSMAGYFSQVVHGYGV